MPTQVETLAQAAHDKTRTERLRRDLRASLLDGAAFGGMVGFGETYLPAFALAVGLGEMAAGMVSSVPLVAGGLMQLASPMAVRLLRSHRRWVVTCAIIQALDVRAVGDCCSDGFDRHGNTCC